MRRNDLCNTVAAGVMNSVSTFYSTGSKLIGQLRLRQFSAHVYTWNDVLDCSTLQTVGPTFAMNCCGGPDRRGLAVHVKG